jgi:hypothetical protein
MVIRTLFACGVNDPVTCIYTQASTGFLFFGTITGSVRAVFPSDQATSQQGSNSKTTSSPQTPYSLVVLTRRADEGIRSVHVDDQGFVFATVGDRHVKVWDLSNLSFARPLVLGALHDELPYSRTHTYTRCINTYVLEGEGTIAMLTSGGHDMHVICRHPVNAAPNTPTRQVSNEEKSSDKLIEVKNPDTMSPVSESEDRDGAADTASVNVAIDEPANGVIVEDDGEFEDTNNRTSVEKANHDAPADTDTIEQSSPPTTTFNKDINDAPTSDEIDNADDCEYHDDSAIDIHLTYRPTEPESQKTNGKYESMDSSHDLEKHRGATPRLSLSSAATIGPNDEDGADDDNGSATGSNGLNAHQPESGAYSGLGLDAFDQPCEALDLPHVNLREERLEFGLPRGTVPMSLTHKYISWIQSERADHYVASVWDWRNGVEGKCVCICACLCSC